MRCVAFRGPCSVNEGSKDQELFISEAFVVLSLDVSSALGNICRVCGNVYMHV